MEVDSEAGRNRDSQIQAMIDLLGAQVRQSGLGPLAVVVLEFLKPLRFLVSQLALATAPILGTSGTRLALWSQFIQEDETFERLQEQILRSDSHS